eukprot:snap_masked-scaffold_6-processed-gene-9.4-mRNA-1 protein AED:1.00 eAED:1.00 QI:0/-1/0/0/-1/1/1/0/367
MDGFIKLCKKMDIQSPSNNYETSKIKLSPKMKTEILSWFHLTSASSTHPPYKSLVEKLINLDPTFQKLPPKDQFKFISKLCERNDLQVDALPEKLKSSYKLSLKKKAFVFTTKQDIEILKIPSGRVINAQNHNLILHMVPQRTLCVADDTGLCQGNDVDYRGVEVLLTTCQNGIKLKPFVVFTSTSEVEVDQIDKNEISGYSKSIFHTANETGTLNELSIDKWIHLVLVPYVQGSGGGKNGGYSMLLLHPRLVKFCVQCEKILSENKILLVCVPTGVTGSVEFLDLDLSKPYRRYIQSAKRKYPGSFEGDVSFNELRIAFSNSLEKKWERLKNEFILCSWKKSFELDQELLASDEESEFETSISRVL